MMFGDGVGSRKHPQQQIQITNRLGLPPKMLAGFEDWH
jgi:hypothetical protein